METEDDYELGEPVGFFKLNAPWLSDLLAWIESWRARWRDRWF